MGKKIIDLDKEYQCSSPNYGSIQIETEDYEIKLSREDLTRVLKEHCETHLKNLGSKRDK